MKHLPKFSELCQCLVNACQAAEPTPAPTVNLDTARYVQADLFAL